MGEWAGVYFRYDVDCDKLGQKRNYKGFVGNSYKYFEPYHILTRGAHSSLRAIRRLQDIAYENGKMDEIIRRTLDVDFIFECVEIGNDAAAGDDIGWFFFNDSNHYGGVMLDVKGSVSKGEGDFKIRYAFVDDTERPTRIMTAREYIENYEENFKYTENERMAELLDDINKEFEQYSPKLMTWEELDGYMSSESLKGYMNAKDVDEV